MKAESTSAAILEKTIDKQLHAVSRTRSGRCVKYNTDYTERNARKRHQQNLIYQVKKALKKCSSERTKEDNDLLTNCQDLVKNIDIAAQNRLIAQAHQEIVIDNDEVLEAKCKQLSDAIVAANGLCLFYTGAGNLLNNFKISHALIFILVKKYDWASKLFVT
jgi:hypothetical protein